MTGAEIEEAFGSDLSSLTAPTAQGATVSVASWAVYFRSENRTCYEAFGLYCLKEGFVYVTVIRTKS